MPNPNRGSQPLFIMPSGLLPNASVNPRASSGANLNNTDILGTILQGLDIASKYYGIKSDIAKLDKWKRDKEREDEKDIGVMRPYDQLSASENFDLEPEKRKDDPSVPAQFIKDDDNSSIYAYIKGRKPDLHLVDTVGDDGKPVQKFVPKKEGESYPKPVNDERDIARRERNQKIADDRAEKAQRRLDDMVVKAGSAIQPYTTILNNIGNVERDLKFKLKDYDKNTGKANGEDVSIPGTDIPGIGRVDFYSTEARMLGAALQKVFNVEIQESSGQNVTGNELKRMQRQFAAGAFNTQEEIIQALKDYQALVQKEMKNTEAKFNPEVIKELQNRGVFTTKDLEEKPVKGEENKKKEKVPIPQKMPKFKPGDKQIFKGKPHERTNDGGWIEVTPLNPEEFKKMEEEFKMKGIK